MIQPLMHTYATLGGVPVIIQWPRVSEADEIDDIRVSIDENAVANMMVGPDITAFNINEHTTEIYAAAMAEHRRG